MKINFKIAFFLILTFLYGNNLFSRQAIKFKHLKAEDGLSQSWVRSIYQDKQGFMWFGTGDGLNKYDGYSVTSYYFNSSDRHSLNSSSVNILFSDEKDNLWIGTDKGLNLYDLAGGRFIHSSRWPQASITDLIETDNGQFLVATRDDGLIVFDPDSGLVKSYLPDINDPFSVSSAVIEVLLKDSKRNIWIGTNNGLALFNPVTERFITFRKDDNNANSLSDNFIESLLEDSRGRIWVGTLNNGLNLLKYETGHPEKSRFKHFLHNPQNSTSISPGAVLSLLEDQSGHLWIGTENGGLDILNLNDLQNPNVTFQHYRFNPFDNTSLSNNSVHSLFKDRDGGIWIGTYGDGVNYYHPHKEKFDHFNQDLSNPQSLNNNFVNVFYEQGDSLWIGTEGGLNLFNKKNGSFRHFVHNPNDKSTIGANAICAIYRDSHHNLWFGTWGGGLNLFNSKTSTFTRFKHDERNSGSIPGNNVYCILEDQSGRLWIGTMGSGLCQFVYHSGTFKKFNPVENDDNTISNNWISALLEDSFGKIWIASTVAVDVFDPESGALKHYKHDTSDIKSISNNIVSIVFEDSHKNVWIGTYNGLNLFNREDDSFYCYNREHGLPNNQIKGILEDNNGNLWISSNKGISKFIQGVKQPETPIFKNYDFSDGLQGNEFNSHSCWKGSDGKLYFGGKNGYNSFFPDSIIRNTPIPEVVLTNFLINNKPVAIGDPGSPLAKHISMLHQVSLNHNQSVFSIEFSILNYLSPDKNQYAFMLDGFDKDWNYVGNQRHATYTNLDPGDYIFRVKGKIGDNAWAHENTSVKIIIVPPWWKTGYAYLFYFLLSGTILFSIWRFQLNRRAMKHQLILEHQHAEKLEELNTIKSRFFANISHEFRSPLTLIMGTLQQFIVNEIKGNLAEMARMALRNSERLYQLINQILELSKLEAGKVALRTQRTDIVNFIKEIIFSFTPHADSRNIKLQCFFSNDLITESSPAQLYIDRDKIQKIISNLLSNALKFTPENGHINVSIKKVNAPVNNQNTVIKKMTRRIGANNKNNFIRRWVPGLRESDHNQTLDDNVIPVLNTQGYIEISVKDDGIGIRNTELSKIFDRFYQVVDPRFGTYESTGIGLALTKELVELHSGTIHVESVFMKGTEFFVRLPLGYDHLLPSEITDVPYHSIKKAIIDTAQEEDTWQEWELEDKENDQRNQLPIILIVDDNVDMRKYFYEHLKSDYKLLIACDGQEALSKAVNQMPDIIISDIVMPNMNGIEFCKEIKNNELTSHIPIIMLTGRASNDSRIEGLETGADDYITKPFEIIELKARIRNLIEQRRKLEKKFKGQIGLKPSEITSNSNDERFLEKALLSIEESISDPSFGVEELALRMAISRVQLYRKIRAITGQSTSGFIRAVRLNRAAQLLKLKHGNVAEIAYEVGFTSPSYFSRSFYKQFGMYPSEYAR